MAFAAQRRHSQGPGLLPRPFGSLTSSHTQYFSVPGSILSPIPVPARRARTRAVAACLVFLATLLVLLDLLGVGPRFLHGRAGHGVVQIRQSEDGDASSPSTTSPAGEQSPVVGLAAPLKEENGNKESQAKCPDDNPACLFSGAPWKPEVYRWLSSCWQEYLQEEPPALQETLYGKPCPSDCNGHGVCNHELGECRCSMGYLGPDCSAEDVYPCNLNATDGYPHGTWTATMCAAHCDTHTTRCVCGPGTKFPTRPVVHPCGFQFLESTGSHNLSQVDKSLLYDKENGFCNVETQGAVVHPGCGACPDGYLPPLCSKAEAFCINQCSGNGECDTGHCKCRDGFYGMDCSAPSTLSPSSGLSNAKFLSGAALPGQAETTPPLKVQGDVITVHRRRPLIYVYDLPREFTTHHLESRTLSWYCTTRFYDGDGRSTDNALWLYGMELAVIEGILSSPHRAMNADEADYFLLPLMGGCAHVRAADSPRVSVDTVFQSSRAYFAADQYQRAYEHVMQEYPYWNRSGGRDHIWIFPWDEGACGAPKTIWPSILLSHWGNTMSRHNYSTSAYWMDTWKPIPLEFRGNHPCFDPRKDIVMPALKLRNAQALRDRFWERSLEERTTFFYFNGNLGRLYGGRPEPEYSMNIRQRVAAHWSHEKDKSGLGPVTFFENVKITATRSPNYEEELSRSRFCGVFPGDGFSARMEDSILSGCIPVVVQDGVEMAFENFLDHSTFSVRILENDIPRMMWMLLDLPDDHVRSLLRNVSSVALRWYYKGYLQLEGERQRKGGKEPADYLAPLDEWKGDDAMDTLIQILAYKLDNNPWRKAHSEGQGESARCPRLKRKPR